MSFNTQLTEFNSNLAHLKEFTELIEPVLLQRQEQRNFFQPAKIVSFLDNLLVNRSLPDEKQNIFLQIKDSLSHIIELLPKDFDKVPLAESSVVEVLENAAGFSKDSLKRIINPGEQKLHLEHLYKNNLISLLSSVEWFFAQLLHIFYDKYPEAPGINKKPLTFEELKNFKNIDEAQKYLVEEKIENLLRGSIETWFAYLKSDLNISLSFTKAYLDDLIEISQRRNLFVHNAGVVNTIYLSEVSKKLTEGLSLNNRLKIDKLYLERSINLMQVVFTLLSAEIWKKLESADTERGVFLSDIAFDFLLDKRWDDAEAITNFLISDAQQEASVKTIAQLNNWFAQKKQGKWIELKPKIETLDFSDKKSLYQLGFAAILEDLDKFFELLPICLNNKEITLWQIEYFPIFESIIADSRWHAIKESLVVIDS